MTFERLGLIGLGLIGSSVARAVRRSGAATRLCGYDRDPAVRQRASEIGLVDSMAETAGEAVATCDAVLLAVPVGQTVAAARALAPALAPGAIVFDAGSVKGPLVGPVAHVLPPGVAWVPAHPVAGTEDSGPDAGLATLFQSRWCILTPEDPTAPAVERVAAFWRSLGAMVEVMDADHHDRVLAVTSHVPHLIAYSLVGTATDLEQVTQSEVIKYSAGGFRDFTRIAASDPVMWRDVFLANRDAVLEVLGRVSEDLAALQRAIRWGDGALLEQRFAASRATRRAIVEAGQDVAGADFGRSRG